MKLMKRGGGQQKRGGQVSDGRGGGLRGGLITPSGHKIWPVLFCFRRHMEAKNQFCEKLLIGVQMILISESIGPFFML